MQDQRVLDIDDVKVFGTKLRALKGERLRVVDPFASGGEVEDGWEIQDAYRLKRRLKRKIIEELRSKDVMPDDKGKMVQNVWTLSLNDRWRLYRRWLMDVSDSCRRTIWLFQGEFEASAKRLKDIKTMEDFEILKNADVIGLTTTGAAKYRKLMKRLQPRITIVEEAAEVLEAHIVTSLTSGCQHLILIGDHQQLRPNPTVYELAKDYNLDVSLFERMVNNGMPFERLNLQHRMRPEISKMLDHIYFNPKLENHQSVLNLENIKGVNGNVFFVDHDESEEYQVEGRSRSNRHEAKFLAALCRYLILQGYKREQITVLTAYTGQLTQLKKEMPKDFFRGVRVCAVDNFQGEENDIILLSLVRSNEEGKIGFLQIENRVCVALSRAKKGFYCIGNISLLKEKSQLWSKIFGDMKKRGNVGTALTLSCQNHPRNVIQASHADDFKKAPEGGCTVPCATRMECGHVCEMACHPTDPEHKQYQCRKPCSKTLCSSNHKCPRKCYQDCGPCEAPCKEILKCQHLCAGNCSLCFRGRVHVPCKSSCGRTLFCGHACSEPCTKNCPPCKERCGNSCTHRKCAHECGEPCEPCNEKCSWQCEHHKCTKLCGQQCNRRRCNEPCKKRISCNHPCIGLCGEKCPERCRVCHKDEVTEIFFGTEDKPNARFVELADCGHVFEVEMMDQWMDQTEASDDGQAVDVKLKRCPKCSTPIRTSLRYGNIVKKILADFEALKRKILLGKQQRELVVNGLRLKVQDIKEFPGDRQKILQSLRRTNLTDEQVNVFENQINLLSFLQDLKVKIEKGAKAEKNGKAQKSCNLFRQVWKMQRESASLLEKLRLRVMTVRARFSDQELEELKKEMYRTQLAVDFKFLKMQLDIRGHRLNATDAVLIDQVQRDLDLESVIDKKDREDHMACIKQIRESCGLRVFHQEVTGEEKDLGLAQGH